jgi:hypothetical protein
MSQAFGFKMAAEKLFSLKTSLVGSLAMHIAEAPHQALNLNLKRMYLL